MEGVGRRRRRRPQKLAVNRGIRKIQGRRAAAAKAASARSIANEPGPYVVAAAQWAARLNSLKNPVLRM